MPLVHFHLVENSANEEQIAVLSEVASHIYADVLESPIERVRVFINFHAAKHMAVGGKQISQGAPAAPFFDFIVLAGRSVEQRQQIHRQFTDLLAEVLGVPRAIIRGRCNLANPEDWSIGGQSAANIRQNEIAARKRDASENG